MKPFFITYPPVASNVYQNIYFLFKKIQTDTNKKQKELKKKTEKQKKPKKKRRKKMLLLWAVSEKYNGVQWYRLRISQFLLVSWNHSIYYNITIYEVHTFKNENKRKWLKHIFVYLLLFYICLFIAANVL